MKGIVFTEFLELVEDRFGLEVVDRVLVDSKVESGGVYTSVGTYDYRELVALVGTLANVTGVEVSELVKAFGRHLLGRFFNLYPSFFENVSTTFEFISMVDETIHVEVQKLYPDAELPSISCVTDGDKLLVDYKSSRPFADLAQGLIEATAEHYGEEIEICREDGEGAVRFELQARQTATN